MWVAVVSSYGKEPADDVVGRTTAGCLGVEPEIIGEVIAKVLDSVVSHRLRKVLEGVVGKVLGVYTEGWLCESRERRWHGDVCFAWPLMI
jgi:hypothetical protein